MESDLRVTKEYILGEMRDLSADFAPLVNCPPANLSPEEILKLRRGAQMLRSYISQLSDVNSQLLQCATQTPSTPEKLQLDVKLRLQCDLILNDISEVLRLLDFSSSPPVGIKLEDGGAAAEGDKGDGKKNLAISLVKSIKLPKFDGDIINWPEFWERFESAVHLNGGIDVGEKFMLLKSLLGGSALECIAGLGISDVNYPIAIQTLSDRFGDEEDLKNSYRENLLALQPIKSLSNVAIRSFFDKFRANFLKLKACTGALDGDSGIILFQSVIKLLPLSLRSDFARFARSASVTRPSITHLDDFLVELVSERKLVPDCAETDATCGANGNSKSGPSGNLKSPSASPNKRKPIPCIFCEVEGHAAEKCNVPMSFDDRMAKVKDNRFCYLCLRGRHLAKDCVNGERLKIKCSLCKGPHWPILCKKATESASGVSVPCNAVTRIISHVSTDNMALFLHTIAFPVQSPDGKYSAVITAMIDSGSARTFISKRTADSLHLPTLKSDDFRMLLVGGVSSSISTINVPVTYYDQRRNALIEINATVLDEVCEPLQAFPQHLADSYARAWQLGIGKRVDGEAGSGVDMLIGIDHYWGMLTGNSRKFDGKVGAVETVFGWLFSGVHEMQHPEPCKVLACQANIVAPGNQECLQHIHSAVEKLWALDQIGVELPQGPTRGNILETIEKLLHPSYDATGKRYSVSLPFRENADLNGLASNFGIALHRYRALRTKLEADHDLNLAYRAIIQSQLDEGIVEAVGPCAPGVPVYYMPHRPVVRENHSTTKVRLVFDASSAKSQALSLNEVVDPGPDLTANLVGILLRFRMKKFVFTADIAKAFLQIGINESDRNLLRFLWFPDNNSREFQILRMARAAFGVSCSPFILMSIIRLHASELESKHPRASKALKDNIYMDDVLDGADNLQELRLLKTDCELLLRSAGFILGKFRSNSAVLMAEWNGVSPQTDIQAFDTDSVLGLKWNRVEDSFFFTAEVLIPSVALALAATKRSILSAFSRIFDPIGFLAPFIVRAKMLLQLLWTEKLGWDDDLPLHLREIWSKWTAELAGLNKLTIPRFLFGASDRNSISSPELHVFADASEKAYAAVAYLKFQSDNGTTEFSFLMAKAKVAPLKRLSIPKLELLACLIAARLATFLKKEMEWADLQCFFWTDSGIALGWVLQGGRNKEIFLANRVSEIRALSAGSIWAHIAGCVNPADLPSRGAGVGDLSTWWSAPASLPPEILCKPKGRLPIPSVVVGHTGTQEDRPERDVLESFSSAERSMVVMAWVLWAKEAFMHRKLLTGAVRAGELFAAENVLIRMSQSRAFSNVLLQLKVKGDKAIVAYGYSIFLDTMGLLRVRGRLQEAQLPYETANPILLKKDNWVQALIRGIHVRLQHAGVSHTLAEMQKRFWVLKGHQVIKAVVSSCITCQKLHARLLEAPTAPLPDYRVCVSRPFENTGVDFIGPLLVQDLGTPEKVYVLLFTCCFTRAIHLELVECASTEAFLAAFTCFGARRGIPSRIISDNAKTFIHADNLLQQILAGDGAGSLGSWCANKRITWEFIAPHAPWWGGMWERLVGSVKTCLAAVIGKTSISRLLLRAVLCETEAVVNSRPLTRVGNEPGGAQVISPASFLTGSAPTVLEAQALPLASTRANVLLFYQSKAQLLKELLARWHRQYTLALRSHFQCKAGRNYDLKLGDVVIIQDKSKSRMFWPLASVEELQKGRDGLVRSVMLRLPNKKSIRRPINALVPVECH